MTADYHRRFIRLDSLYEVEGGIGDPCVYCGLPSVGFDHVPPLHYVDRLRECDLEVATLRKFPACEECNKILGGVVVHTLTGRRGYVKQRLRKRYRSHAEMPEWSEDEIAELSTKDARRYMQGHGRFSRTVKARIAHTGRGR